MATKKKAVAKKKSAPAATKEQLWEVRMRGFRSEPRLRVIVDAATDEEAREKAKAQVTALGLATKPVVHAAIEHADWYRIWAKERDSFTIIRRITVFDNFKKGYGSRDDEGFKNTVGCVSVELDTPDTGGDQHVEPSCGVVYFGWDKNGLFGSYVDDDLYQEPPKVFYARLNFSFDDILGEMSKALKEERGLTVR